ncbi:unnamed protein product [Cuscuta campestris]|uniref:Gnk2-homologous domain-containing protein n=1 Tax=Cuscuta campestris TaxID=132261 RepID=A0A484LNR1_9ASTE|nr:unnamed protein product [Cuscuta campestris]
MMEVLFLLLLTLFSIHMIVPPPAAAAAHTDSIYTSCSRTRFNPGTVYESNVNSALTSLVNSANSVNFNKFKTSLPGSTEPDVVYSLYQCRGDLSVPDCRTCVAAAVSRLGSLCQDTSGGSLQLEGCLVRYDNVSFLGAAEDAVSLQKCGPTASSGDVVTGREAVLTYLTEGGQYFRVGGYGRVQGMAQCTQDVDPQKCQDCLRKAIDGLGSTCGSASWGYVYLSKCYARFSERGFSTKSGKPPFPRLARWSSSASTVCGFLFILGFL